MSGLKDGIYDIGIAVKNEGGEVKTKLVRCEHNEVQEAMTASVAAFNDATKPIIGTLTKEGNNWKANPDDAVITAEIRKLHPHAGGARRTNRRKSRGRKNSKSSKRRIRR
jgi:hypothetical protein